MLNSGACLNQIDVFRSRNPAQFQHSKMFEICLHDAKSVSIIRKKVHSSKESAKSRFELSGDDLCVHLRSGMQVYLWSCAPSKLPARNRAEKNVTLRGLFLHACALPARDVTPSRITCHGASPHMSSRSVVSACAHVCGTEHEPPGTAEHDSHRHWQSPVFGLISFCAYEIVNSNLNEQTIKNTVVIIFKLCLF